MGEESQVDNSSCHEINGVHFSLDEVVGRLHHASKKKVAVGLRPSGEIHLGNMSTLLLSAWLTHYLGASTTELEITICDIDLSSDAKGKVAIPFKYLESPSKEYPNLAEYHSAKIAEFMGLVQSEVGIKYHFQNLSDVQKGTDYRRGIERLIAERSAVKKILNGETGENRKVPINPVCPKCHTVTRAFPVVTTGRRSSDTRIIEADCKNESCDAGRYKFELYDPEIEIAVHYLIDPMRDSAVQPNADVHVFGGDYLSAHTREMPKVQKVKLITEIAGGNSPLYFVGPTFYGEDGGKMSKSNIAGLTFDALRAHFLETRKGEPWVRQTLEFVKYLINERVKQVDYSITRQHLLGGDLTKGNLR